MPEIQIEDTTIEYELNRANRRSISASILPDGTLVVKAPHLIPEFIIRRFLKSRGDWILSHVQRKKNNPGKQLVPQESGEYMCFFDKTMLLIVTDSSEAKKVRLYRVNNTFQIIVPSSYTGKKRTKAISDSIHNWYRTNMYDELVKRVSHYAEIVGVKYEKIRVKDVSSHWGSCSIDRNLNFNYRLAMLPVELADYVIVHELCHIFEMNHSAAFWAKVEQFVPNYRELRKELKKYHFL